MNNEIIKLIIEKGEGITTEFKSAQKGLPKSIYETVCSFSNRNGGIIFLGVDDERQIIGIPREQAESYLKDITTSLTNKQRFNYEILVNPELREIDGKLIIVINIPVTQEPIKFNNHIYDRLNESDIDITNNENAVKLLYLRKSNIQVLDLDDIEISYDDLDENFIIDITNKITEKRIKNKEEIIKELINLQLATLNNTTNEIKIKKSALLLYGTDESIFRYFNNATIDCLYYANNERYNDAIKVETNLLKAYDTIMNFILKHTDNKFFIEGQYRIDYREILFREIVVNMLIHRNYGSGIRSRIEIDNEQIIFKNPAFNDIYNNTNPSNITPNAKNKDIAKVFRYYNLAEEFGSGLRKIFKYSEKYTGNIPHIENKEIYELKLSLKENEENKIINNDNVDIKEKIVKLIKQNNEITKKELSELLNVSFSTITRKIKEIDNLYYVQDSQKGKWYFK